MKQVKNKGEGEANNCFSVNHSKQGMQDKQINKNEDYGMH